MAMRSYRRRTHVAPRRERTPHGGSRVAESARIEQQDSCGLCHDPIVVYDDLRLDDNGQPAAWLYHIECYDCGQAPIRGSAG
jgi:hypothetical protein